MISVGRAKEAWIEEGIAMYTRRLISSVTFSFVWVKNDEQLFKALKREERVICLDPKGQMMSSEVFSKKLHSLFEESGGRLTFAIGGHEGLPKQIADAHELLSLSSMTLTHQMSRLFLVEQVYRAMSIANNTGYHK